MNKRAIVCGRDKKGLGMASEKLVVDGASWGRGLSFGQKWEKSRRLMKSPNRIILANHFEDISEGEQFLIALQVRTVIVRSRARTIVYIYM